MVPTNFQVFASFGCLTLYSNPSRVVRKYSGVAVKLNLARLGYLSFNRCDRPKRSIGIYLKTCRIVSLYTLTPVLLKKSSARTMNVEVKNKYCDSTIWNSVSPRKTDVVIASCYKSGTTLTQQIVNLLLNGNSDLRGYKSIHELSPWVEYNPDPTFASLEVKLNHIENLPDPRFLKTHLPFDALPYNRETKYIYLVRDGRDVALSLYNAGGGYDPSLYEEEKVEETFPEFWDNWLETGRHLWPLWENILSWWQVRHLPNVLLVHYANLITDKPKEVERMAELLGVKMDAAKKDLVLQESSLEYMTENWEKFQSPGFLPKRFFGKGKNGRWKDLLPSEKIEKYEVFIVEKLGLECAHWVKNGGYLPGLIQQALDDAIEEAMTPE